MARYRECKIWVGDDPYLMKATIKVLEADGCTEHKEFNIGKPPGKGVYVNKSGAWYYSKVVVRERADCFGNAVHAELPLTALFPMCHDLNCSSNNKYKIWTGGYMDLSAKIQQALFNNGYEWVGIEGGRLAYLEDPFIMAQFRNSRQIYRSGSTMSNTTRGIYEARGEIELFPLQIPGWIEPISSSSNTHHESQRKTQADPGATGGRGLRSEVGAGKIASTERIVGNALRAKPCHGKVGKSVLGRSVLVAGHY